MIVRLGVAAGLIVMALPASAHALSETTETRVLYRGGEHKVGVAVDRSGLGNDGALLGGAGRRDGAYRFHALSRDRHYDRIEAPSSRSFNPGSAPFSYGVRLKVRPNAEWSHSEMAVLRHGDTDSPGGDYKLELKKNSDGTVSAFCVFHDGVGGSAYVHGRGALETIADQQWHTVTCSRVDADTVSITIDGVVEERPTTGVLGSIVGKDDLLIGCQLRSDGVHRREQFVGAMDNIVLRVG